MDMIHLYPLHSCGLIIQTSHIMVKLYNLRCTCTSFYNLHFRLNYISEGNTAIHLKVMGALHANRQNFINFVSSHIIEVLS